MAKYKAYIKANKRKLIVEADINYQRALDFLSETKNGIIVDNTGKEFTSKEELEYVKSIGSLPGIGADSIPASRKEVHEDPHRELLETLRDYTKSSSERDN
jgi:hypothetical protein